MSRELNERLAQRLDDLGLEGLAAKARTGMYDPEHSPYRQPTEWLIYELGYCAGGCTDPEKTKEIFLFTNSIISGDFDTVERTAVALAVLARTRDI